VVKKSLKLNGTDRKSTEFAATVAGKLRELSVSVTETFGLCKEELAEHKCKLAGSHI